MRKSLIFSILAVLLLAPWPVAYAHDNALAGQAAYRIEAAPPPATPAWTAFGKATGGVDAAVDLFYLDVTDNPAEISVRLHMTNAAELVHYYRYMILKVGIYVQTGAGQWEAATAANGEPIPETYLTMKSGSVGFSLPGYARYRVTIDDGSFYCFQAGTDGGGVSPRFYLTAE